MNAILAYFSDTVMGYSPIYLRKAPAARASWTYYVLIAAILILKYISEKRPSQLTGVALNYLLLGAWKV